MLSPFETFEHLKESLCSYLETAYKIADPVIFRERGERLRASAVAPLTPVTTQEPFIESTPPFAASEYLADLVARTPQLPQELEHLAAFGMPVRSAPLYDHQREAIERAYSCTRNLIVATGTGSGKTEIFLLLILAEILKEALGNGGLKPWDLPRGRALPAEYSAREDQWLHSRRHERRRAAIRAIVLYPMNALVNDQLQRLRRVLAGPESEAWQRTVLRDNLIHFGMYTGDRKPTGHWSDERRRRAWSAEVAEVQRVWDGLPESLRGRGNWPRPDGPEMLCRWDMQEAPPDVLVTNYSMLEYMLVRPIEAKMLDLTRAWLKATPAGQLTLVVDEAHTYTGARGTEIAYLIRRLKERLGITPGDGKLRCIATSASLPDDDQARAEVLRFAAELFGEAAASFWPVSVPPVAPPVPCAPSTVELAAFARFSETFNTLNPLPAITELSQSLGTPLEPGERAEAALARTLQAAPQVSRARALTARRATRLPDLAEMLWGELGSDAERRRATAGVFAAGAFARERDAPDAQPLISSRVHMFFRGIAGLWACMDPNCAAAERLPGTRAPAGRLSFEPRPWCACDARVLEVFTCRVCGLLFLGGIADATGSLWPWTSDLQSGRPDLNDYSIFGVEAPEPAAAVSYRSVRSTRPVAAGDANARPVYEVQAASVGRAATPFPAACPRCRSRRGRGAEAREIVEPLRTKGTNSFSLLLEDAFRLQPPSPGSETGNQGRKLLTFSDSRQEAAMLAGDLEIDHTRDSFRQMAYRLLFACRDCLGYGSLPAPPSFAELTPLFPPAQADSLVPSAPSVAQADSLFPPTSPLPSQGRGRGLGHDERRPGRERAALALPCPACGGSGQLPAGPQAIPVAELRQLLLGLARRARINPTLDARPAYFADLTDFWDPNASEAERTINALIRNEIAAPDFGLEPMGLAAWRADFPRGVSGTIPGMSAEETDDLIDGVVRVLAMEDVLLPPSRNPIDWPDLVPHWDRQLVLAPGAPARDGLVPFDPAGRRRLGRYLRAVAEALSCRGSLRGESTADRWLAELTRPLFVLLTRLGILLPDAGANGYGIGIDRFRLEPPAKSVQVCQACGYVSNRAALGVCIRCGQQTAARPSAEIHNFYRRIAGYARPGSETPDPFALRVYEHTAQIEKPEARRFELWFQDVFLHDENPDDRRIDVLSVTTTMEMGIDIGNLLSVGMRNVPPAVANYQQRAGRAGRRGTGVATVLTFAQNRGHDQYYFAHPPRIVSDPPRIPRLQIENRVIARRHVRALVLQRFFQQWPPTLDGRAGGLLNAWGSVTQFKRRNGTSDLGTYVGSCRVPLAKLSRQVAACAYHDEVDGWVRAIPDEVTQRLGRARPADDVLAALLDDGYLPRHAFPIDLVSLWTEERPPGAGERERGVQRDLGIALSEFAPGAEVVRNKRIYRVAGLYDPYDYNPSYQPDGQLVECRDCHSVRALDRAAEAPVICEVCQGGRLTSMRTLRPPGFCSDWNAEPLGRPYRGGGRERAGISSPARLAVGENSFSSADAFRPEYAPALRVLVHIGTLHVVNRGPDPLAPGFRICPTCGRALDALNAEETDHTYPASLPPTRGARPGPRAGTPCPNQAPPTSRVLLTHRFPSEVVLLGVDLPAALEADSREVSGRAVWLSFGALLQQAAARELQINPEELRVDVRSVRRPDGRVLGEVYLYDTLPGGAGYARDVQANLERILRRALRESRACSNPDCAGACYGCLYDYQNQLSHPLLDRGLGRAVLEFLLECTSPSIRVQEADEAAARLREYLPDQWTAERPAAQPVAGLYVPLILTDDQGRQMALAPRHALAARPDSALQEELLFAGLECASYTSFDLERRPFWVIQQIAGS